MFKTKFIATCLLGLVFIDINSIFFEENYKRRDDEPAKQNMTFDYNSRTVTASGTTSTASPSPSLEIPEI